MSFRGLPRLSALLVVLLLTAARPAVAKSSSPQAATLKKAIRMVARLEDNRAKVLLLELLRHAPPASIAVQCHLYLGIIALNTLDPAEAKAEFKRAIAVDPTAELPVTVSPKARLVYGEAQKELAQSEQLPAPPAREAAQSSEAATTEPTQAAPEATAPAPAGVSAPVERSANHFPAYVVGGVAVAALAGGIIFGVEANVTTTQAQDSTSAVGLEAKGVQVGTFGLIADVCYGVSLAAAVTAVVLFFTEKPEGAGGTIASPPTASLLPVPGGAVLSAGGRF